jgi:SAM-dependent methyltransferase
MPIIEPDSQIYSATASSAQSQDTVESKSILDARIGIRWQGVDCQFTDWSYLQNINLWRDYLPQQIESKLPGSHCGDEVSETFVAGDLLEDRARSQLHRVKREQFQPPTKGLSEISPCLGRFYPKDFFQHIDGIYEGNKFPCRITQVDNNFIDVDMNHPLAGKSIELIFHIDAIRAAGAERGGRCNDIVSQTCDLGPGLQDRLPDAGTDFFCGNPFSRLDPGNDSVFFKQPDLQPFWDRNALQQVSQLYQALIPTGAKVLDLMAGVHSPLQEAEVDVDSVTCAGLNETELEHNPVCTQHRVLDVNAIDALPFDDALFDVVLIHAAIEYVINPDMLFAEIQRILKPGGRVIISFSNRSVAEKTIQLWSGAHEFERPGIVLAYLRTTGGFGKFNSFSMRGLVRPEGDRLAHKLLLSDPVYAIWADKL